MVSDPFEVSGSTEDLSADDLLRELCGDEPGEAVVRDESDGAANHLEEQTGDGEDFPADESREGGVYESAVAGTEASSIDLDEYLSAHKGQFFIYDIETAPDESRFPRPAVTIRPREDIDLPKLVAGNADIITRTLRSGTLKDDQLETLRELEEAGKGRATVIKEIEKAFANMDGEFDKWVKEGSVDPWRGRIVAMSFSFLGEDEIHTLLAKTEDEERTLLATFWMLQETGVRVGYNTKAFDDKWIVVRSMILGVEPTVQMETGKYSKQSVDMMWMMFDTLADAKDCKFVASSLGIRIPAEGVTGADVFSLVDTQAWELLEKYSASDVFVEKELFKKVRKYLR